MDYCLIGLVNLQLLLAHLLPPHPVLIGFVDLALQLRLQIHLQHLSPPRLLLALLPNLLLDRHDLVVIVLNCLQVVLLPF